MGFLNKSRKDEPKQAAPTSSSKWASSFLDLASYVRASAEAGMTKLSNEFNQALSIGGAQNSSSTSTSHQVEVRPQCKLRFSSVGALVDHVENTMHQLIFLG